MKGLSVIEIYIKFIKSFYSIQYLLLIRIELNIDQYTMKLANKPNFVDTTNSHKNARMNIGFKIFDHPSNK